MTLADRETLYMKDIKNWLKAALVIGLIVLLNYSSQLIIQIEPYIHVEYTIFPFVFNILLSLLIGISCGWVIKASAEKATQYFVMAVIMFLILLFPVLYFMLPIPWLPSFFAVIDKEYKIESLVFGLFLMMAVKSRIAYIKAKRNAV